MLEEDEQWALSEMRCVARINYIYFYNDTPFSIVPFNSLQYAGIRIGPVVKRDVMKASTMLEHDKK